MGRHIVVCHQTYLQIANHIGAENGKYLGQADIGNPQITDAVSPKGSGKKIQNQHVDPDYRPVSPVPGPVGFLQHGIINLIPQISKHNRFQSQHYAVCRQIQ